MQLRVRFKYVCLLIVLLIAGFRTGIAAPLKNFRASGWAPVNGARLYYEIYGRGAPLVFLHAGLADSRMWDEQIKYLSGNYTIVRFDARGYGRSDPPTASYAPVDDLYLLLKFLGIDRASIIGLSMGGTFALDFAAAHPEAVSALVVVSGSPGWLPLSDGLVQRTAAILTAAQEKGSAFLVEGWMADPMLAAARGQPRIARQMRMFLNQNAGGLLGTRFMRPPDIPVPKLADLKMPTLIMVGERDDSEIVDRARVMSHEIGGAKEVIVKGAGHMVNLEKAREFNRALAAFLRSVN